MAPGVDDHREGRVGARDPRSLVAARLALHWAAQIPAAAGASLTAPRPDFSHTALGWLPGLEAMVGTPLPGGFRAALRPGDLSLAVLDGSGEPLATRGLAGLTLFEGLAWLSGALAEVLGGEPGELTTPDHELPEHPVAAGRPFADEDPEGRAELVRWYALAARVLGAVADEHAEAGPPRLWPHHFDLATLLVLDPGLDPERARSIGVGLSPGDDSFDQPYLYVLPWPAPEGIELPDLVGGGGWSTADWTGAVLLGSQVAGADAAAQRAQVEAFLASAIAASRGLL